METKRVHIIIDWNKYCERWVLKDGLGMNMFELPDCKWFRHFFPGADKDRRNWFVNEPFEKDYTCEV